MHTYTDTLHRSTNSSLNNITIYTRGYNNNVFNLFLLVVVVVNSNHEWSFIVVILQDKCPKHWILIFAFPPILDYVGG